MKFKTKDGEEFILEIKTNPNPNPESYDFQLKRYKEMIDWCDLETLNKTPVPRYHIYDEGPELTVIDIYETFPGVAFKRHLVRGYIYIGDESGEHLYFHHHCASDNRKEVEAYLKYLKEIRSSPFPF